MTSTQVEAVLNKIWADRDIYRGEVGIAHYQGRNYTRSQDEDFLAALYNTAYALSHGYVRDRRDLGRRFKYEQDFVKNEVVFTIP